MLNIFDGDMRSPNLVQFGPRTPEH